jgi:glycosyltransferase involved in cell wall biosynthesis
MKKLKIVHIIPELNRKIMGGIGRFLESLLIHIDRQNTENLVVTYKSDLSARKYYQNNLGVNVYSLLEHSHLPDKNAIETTQWLINILKETKPDVVHTHYFWADILGIKASSITKIPVIISTNHNVHLDETEQQQRIKKTLTRKIDQIVCVSKSVKKYAEEIDKIPDYLLTLIYNGLSLKDYPFHSLKDGLAENSTFVYVSRLEPQKAPFRLIEAFNLFQKKGYNTQLLIIGEGSLRQECEYKVEELNLTKKVKFLGYQSQPWQKVSERSIFILTSDFEGLPFSVLEAMASGCLCILPNLESLLEIAIKDIEAIFYQAGNIDNLLEVMELCSKMSLHKKQQIIKKAREKVEKNFDIKEMANQYLQLYQELYSRKLGENLTKEGNLNKAISAYRNALKINPKSAWCYLNLAEILSQKGWRKEASNFYAQAWLSNPEQVQTWNSKYKQIVKNKSQYQAKIEPIFVVGCYHSGTTLMRKLLSNYHLFYRINGESLIFTKTILEIETTLQKWDVDCLENNQKSWVEKTPEHIFLLGKIFAHVPKCKIIWILRDGRDVICSQLKAPLKILGFDKLLTYWIASNIAGLSFLKDSRVKLVKYDDLVINPEQELKDIFKFLEEDYTSEILNYHKKGFFLPLNNQFIDQHQLENKSFKEYYSKLRNWQINQPIFDGRGRWKKEMTKEQKEIFKQKAQLYLEKFGYVTNDKW